MRVKFLPLRKRHHYLCRQRTQWSEDAGQPIGLWIAKRPKLRVNADKSGVGRPGGGKFPGFRINSDGRITPAEASLEKLKGQVREHWNAQSSITLEERIKRWQWYIRGWWNCFGISQQQRDIRVLEG
jgi:hypothetical protein